MLSVQPIVLLSINNLFNSVNTPASVEVSLNIPCKLLRATEA